MTNFSKTLSLQNKQIFFKNEYKLKQYEATNKFKELLRIYILKIMVKFVIKMIFEPARQEAQEGPQVRHSVLKARPLAAFPHGSQERLDLTRPKLSEGCDITVEADECEQL